MLIKLNGTVSREEYGVFSYKGDDLHFQILCQRALNFTNVVLAYINHVYWKHNLVKKDTFLGGAQHGESIYRADQGGEFIKLGAWWGSFVYITSSRRTVRLG